MAILDLSLICRVGGKQAREIEREWRALRRERGEREEEIDLERRENLGGREIRERSGEGIDRELEGSGEIEKRCWNR